MHRFELVVTSFGYGHGSEFTDRQHMTYDVRAFRDPLIIDGLRERTGLDADVRDHVLATSGVRDLIEMITDHATSYARLFGAREVIRVAIGCGGGRHRAPAIAREVAAELQMEGDRAELIHRDIDRPVLGGS